MKHLLKWKKSRMELDWIVNFSAFKNITYVAFEPDLNHLLNVTKKTLWFPACMNVTVSGNEDPSHYVCTEGTPPCLLI